MGWWVLGQRFVPVSHVGNANLRWGASLVPQLASWWFLWIVSTEPFVWKSLLTTSCCFRFVVLQATKSVRGNNNKQKYNEIQTQGYASYEGYETPRSCTNKMLLYINLVLHSSCELIKYAYVQIHTMSEQQLFFSHVGGSFWVEPFPVHKSNKSGEQGRTCWGK